MDALVFSDQQVAGNAWLNGPLEGPVTVAEAFLRRSLVSEGGGGSVDIGSAALAWVLPQTTHNNSGDGDKEFHDQPRALNLTNSALYWLP